MTRKSRRELERAVSDLTDDRSATDRDADLSEAERHAARAVFRWRRRVASATPDSDPDDETVRKVVTAAINKTDDPGELTAEDVQSTAERLEVSVALADANPYNNDGGEDG